MKARYKKRTITTNNSTKSNSHYRNDQIGAGDHPHGVICDLHMQCSSSILVVLYNSPTTRINIDNSTSNTFVHQRSIYPHQRNTHGVNEVGSILYTSETCANVSVWREKHERVTSCHTHPTKLRYTRKLSWCRTTSTDAATDGGWWDERASCDHGPSECWKLRVLQTKNVGHTTVDATQKTHLGCGRSSPRGRSADE